MIIYSLYLAIWLCSCKLLRVESNNSTHQKVHKDNYYSFGESTMTFKNPEIMKMNLLYSGPESPN